MHCKDCYEFHIIKLLMQQEIRNPFLAQLGRYVVQEEDNFPKFVVEHLETQINDDLYPFYELDAIFTIKVEKFSNFFFRLSGLSRETADLNGRMTEYDVFAQVELGGCDNDGKRVWIETWSIRR